MVSSLNANQLTRLYTLESCSSRNLSIHMNLAEEHLNRDTRLELSGCWLAAFEETGSQDKHTNLQVPVTPSDEPCMNPDDIEGRRCE